MSITLTIPCGGAAVPGWGCRRFVVLPLDELVTVARIRAAAAAEDPEGRRGWVGDLLTVSPPAATLTLYCPRCARRLDVPT